MFDSKTIFSTKIKENFFRYKNVFSIVKILICKNIDLPKYLTLKIFIFRTNATGSCMAKLSKSQQQ